MTAGIEKIVASDISATDKLISKLDNARLDHDAKLNKVCLLNDFNFLCEFIVARAAMLVCNFESVLFLLHEFVRAPALCACTCALQRTDFSLR